MSICLLTSEHCISGFINDVMANYTTIYYLLGGLSLMPSVLWSLVPFVNQDKIRNIVWNLITHSPSSFRKGKLTLGSELLKLAFPYFISNPLTFQKSCTLCQSLCTTFSFLSKWPESRVSYNFFLFWDRMDYKSNENSLYLYKFYVVMDKY